MLTDLSLEKLSSGKSCDFLVEMDEFILLVESKATAFTRDILTRQTIENDNSTKKVAHGIEQVCVTAEEVRRGTFEPLNVSATKPIFGIVSTFGYIPFANAPWYFEPHFSSKGSVDLHANLAHDPLILDLQSLGLLIGSIRGLDRSLPEFIAEKQQAGFAAAGDWDSYLRKSASKLSKAQELLPHVPADADAFFASLGISQKIG